MQSMPLRPGRTAVAAICLLFAAIVARTLNSPRVGELAPWYLALFATFFILYTLTLLRPGLPAAVQHLYLTLQCGLIFALLSLNPEIDFMASLFPLLSYQAALIFKGRRIWLWVGMRALLTPASLMVLMDPAKGLALGLSTLPFVIILPAFVVANEELERARAESHALLGELRETHRQLKAHAAQAEELAALEERNRLARELHDSVSQTLFSIILNTRSAQILLERDPGRLKPQLEQLQALAQNALVEMRGLISKMRPTGE